MSRLVSVTGASKRRRPGRPARAAGRACRPCALRHVDLGRHCRPPQPDRRRLGCPRPARRPRWSCLPSRPRSASAATASSAAPVDARTTAATSPSTSGALDSRTRSASVGIDELQRHLGAEHRAAEVEQHAVRRPGCRPVLDRLGDRRRVSAERRRVQPGRDLDPRPADPRQPSRGEPDRRLGQRTAVRDDDDPDHDERVRAAASSSSVVLVAPGSWWPALRSPR